MGMGEPLLNYDAVMTAIQILSEPCGMAIAAKAITLSTVGIIPGIRRFTAERHRARLGVSLTSADPLERRRAHQPPIGRRVDPAIVVLAAIEPEERIASGAVPVPGDQELAAVLLDGLEQVVAIAPAAGPVVDAPGPPELLDRLDGALVMNVPRDGVVGLGQLQAQVGLVARDATWRACASLVCLPQGRSRPALIHDVPGRATPSAHRRVGLECRPRNGGSGGCARASRFARRPRRR